MHCLIMHDGEWERRIPDVNFRSHMCMHMCVYTPPNSHVNTYTYHICKKKKNVCSLCCQGETWAARSLGIHDLIWELIKLPWGTDGAAAQWNTSVGEGDLEVSIAERFMCAMGWARWVCSVLRTQMKDKKGRFLEYCIQWAGQRGET